MFQKVLLLLLTCSLYGCVGSKLNNQLQEHALVQEQSQLAIEQSLFPVSSTPLNWDQALELALKHNPDVKRSESAVQQAQKEKKEQWKDYIPDLFVFTSLNKSITEIADLTKDDFDLNVVSNLKIPNPVRYYTKAYALALQQIQAEWNFELERRHTHARLYQLFKKQEAIDSSKRLLLAEEKTLPYTPSERYVESLDSIQSQRRTLSHSEEQLRLELNRFFNSPKGNWSLVGSPPKISYEKALHRLKFSEGFGALGTKLQTLQIETSIIQLWNAKYRRLPTFNIGVSTPSLFNSQNSNSFGFREEEFQLFTGLTKSIKPHDILDRELIKDAELRARLNREQLLRQMENEIVVLEINKRTYKQLLSEKRRTEYQLKHLLTSNRINSSQASKFSELNKELQSANNRLLQLELQFWIWDENYWN